MEAFQMLIDWWTDNQNMEYTNSEKLFSIKMEGNSNICFNKDELSGYFAKWNKLVPKKKWCMIQLIWDTWSSRIIAERSMMLIANKLEMF
jgi:hypothetical protein